MVVGFDWFKMFKRSISQKAKPNMCSNYWQTDTVYSLKTKNLFMENYKYYTKYTTYIQMI